MTKKIFICSCSSLEHQMFFWRDKDDKLLYTEVHLVTYHNFFKRLWYGLKYAFGYKSRFGAWDEFLFDKESEKELSKYLSGHNSTNE